MRWFRVPFTKHQLGPLEIELLEHIWKCGRTTVRDLLDSGRSSLAYTTVMTTLDRLYKKGMLHRHKQGRAFIYSPAVSRAEFGERMARHAVHVMLDYGDADNGAVLSHFVDAIGETDEHLLDELQRAVERRRRRRS